MRMFTTRRLCSPLSMMFVLALLVLGSRAADAQVNPLWDHYKVYLTPPFPGSPINIPVVLTDQFGIYNHNVLELEMFMNPTQKQVLGPAGGTYPIHDDITHYSWWRITPQPFGAVVAATNQFGDQTLHVHDAVYLLTPALKNNQNFGGLPPFKNHYKCYFCDGQPINKQVLLTDQFGQWSTTVTFPRFFCNPVDKHVVDPYPDNDYPILDPNQHYVCYEFQPEDGTPYMATVLDQFTRLIGYFDTPPLPLHPARYLCVPTYKYGFTESARYTWGRLKLLYR
jgi:hypothetical protein